MNPTALVLRMASRAYACGKPLARTAAKSRGYLSAASCERRDLTPPASISSRRSFVYVGVSETLKQLPYEQEWFSAPVRKRTHRAGDGSCVAYAAASRAGKARNFLYAIPPPKPAAAIATAAAIFAGPRPGAMCHGHLSSGYLSGRGNPHPGALHLRAIIVYFVRQTALTQLLKPSFPFFNPHRSIR
jgi:hypothetical protein